MLEIACFVDIGLRTKNDDRVAVNSKLISKGSYSETAENSCLTIVCDGVGGEAFGNEAAEMVTDVFSRISGSKINVDIINDYIAKANEAVINAQKKDESHSRMTTTIAGLYINENDFISFNVGDSRVYRYRSPYIMQLSTDHSLPEKTNVITRYIGGDYAEADIVEGKSRVFDKDIYVLCSDGVWGSLKNEDFENELLQKSGLEEKCQSLVKLALEKGSRDNLSIIIIRRS